MELKLHFETTHIKEDKETKKILAKQLSRLVLTSYIVVTLSPIIAVIEVLIWITLVVFQSY